MKNKLVKAIWYEVIGVDALSNGATGTLIPPIGATGIVQDGFGTGTTGLIKEIGSNGKPNTNDIIDYDPNTPETVMAVSLNTDGSYTIHGNTDVPKSAAIVYFYRIRLFDYNNEFDLGDIPAYEQEVYELGKTRLIAPSNIQAFKLISINPVNYYDKDTTGMAGKQIGFSLDTVTTGQDFRCQFEGKVYNATWGLVPNTMYFAGNNGDIVTLPPTTGFVQAVGIALDSTTLLINFQEPTIKSGLVGNKFIKLNVDGVQEEGVPDGGGGGSGHVPIPATVFEDLLAGDAVNIFEDAGIRKVRKAIASDYDKPCNGFVLDAFLTGQEALVYREGINPSATINGTGQFGDNVFISESVAGQYRFEAPTGNVYAQTVGIYWGANSLEIEIEQPVRRKA